MKFFHVYIIESPSADDFYNKRFEGEALEKTLNLSGISSSHHLVVDLKTFYNSFFNGLKEYFDRRETFLPPIIHLSAHGNNNGIELTNGNTISWDIIKILVTPVNNSLNGGLLLCMSSCEGFAGCQMAMQNGELPFWAIIGNNDKPTWGETNIGFAAFYHLFRSDKNIFESVSGMKAASGNSNFMHIEGQIAQNLYLQRLRSEDIMPEMIRDIRTSSSQLAGLKKVK
jgi:hypothetical protein